MPPEALTVLHVAEPTDYGVARCVADLTTDQVERGWRVSLLAPDGGVLTNAAQAGGVSVLRWGEGRSAVTAVSHAAAVRTAVRSIRPDVVHLHSSKAGALGRLVLRGSP